MEEWRQIAGYEGLYEVSNLGRVRSLGRSIANSDKSTRFIAGQIIKPYVRQTGYHTVRLARGRKKTSYYVHRLVAVAFHGMGATGEEVLHRDGDKGRNLETNLCWGTRLDNMADRSRLGESARGETHGMAKLKEAQVRTIILDGRPQKVIAVDFGISRSLVTMIKQGKVWSHLR